MQKAANLIRGWVEIQVTGPDGEEFLNLCARKNIPFWDVAFVDETTLRLRLPFGKWRAASALGKGGRWEVRLLRRRGAPGLLFGLRYRYGLLVGLALAVAVVSVLSRFVLTIRVSGNIRVPTESILTQLRAQGVRPGVYGPDLKIRDICHGVILEIPQLCWMTINLHGTVAEVLVREGEPRPELVEEDVSAHVEAKFSGIITHMETTRGQALVEEGDTVAAGDTLISGWVDFEEPEGATTDWGGIQVRASGRVVARTWHTLTASIPLEGERKAPTGKEKTRWSLEFFGRRVKFYRNSGIPFEKYDKITSYHTARLPGGQNLPISLKKETWAEYETERVPIDQTQGEILLKAQLQKRLDGLVGEGEILKTDYQSRREDGLLTVTLLAECRQEIGVTVED